MKKKWMLLAAGVVVGGTVLIAARSGNGKKNKSAESPFRLGTVQAENLQVAVREVGVVDPETKVDVKSSVSGKVIALKVREGDRVRVGQVLAEVEPDVNQAQSLSEVQAAVTEAELKLKDAERQYRAQKALFDSGLIGREALKDAQTVLDLASEGLKAARVRYRIVEDRGIPIAGDAASQRARVTSPMNGIVITRGVELGETVTSGVSSFNAGTVLFTVADLKSLLIRVNLNEVDIAKVHVGQNVRITLDAYPQKIFAGNVRFVAPAAKLVDKIKVFPIEIALSQLSDAYRTGMSANVEILGERREHALSIPIESLMRRDGQTVAYRLKASLKPDQIASAKEGLSGRSKYTWLSEHWKDYFQPVPVTAGVATLERVEIVSGLKSGDRVALEDPTRKKIEKDDEND
jgi:RND family efflux transporter MFP subunit